MSAAAAALRFSMLGPLEVESTEGPVALGGAKQRTVLAVLLANAGRMVAVPDLIDAVWDGDAGDKAEATLQVYISSLRRAFGADGGAVVVRRGHGYLLDAAAGWIDLLEFRRLTGEATRAGAGGAALDLLREALGLWRGRALADLNGVRFADQFAITLEEERLATVERRLSLELDLTTGDEVIGELTSLTQAHPLRERMWALLMKALFRSGRQADALNSYQQVREILAESLGVDPGKELREMYAAILAEDPSLMGPPKRAALDLSKTVMAPDGGRRPTFLVVGDERVPIEKRNFTIGRSPECDLVLDDDQASRRHAELVATVDGYFVNDLGSTNGTKVGGEFVSRSYLVGGEVIQIGGTTLRLEID
jgi:DNA-binding SARP family transcriptional activator